ncbi:hypothetical protein ABZ470_30330 [Streptosporangium sp. NPDC020072]|uniref:Uncharacterized protein n=1 Tax=Streptosporangium jomthongense TaxID=1193683 RepID=A0ABV8F395_9ACTN
MISELVSVLVVVGLIGLAALLVSVVVLVAMVTLAASTLRGRGGPARRRG